MKPGAKLSKILLIRINSQNFDKNYLYMLFQANFISMDAFINWVVLCTHIF